MYAERLLHSLRASITEWTARVDWYDGPYHPIGECLCILPLMVIFMSIIILHDNILINKYRVLIKCNRFTSLHLHSCTSRVSWYLLQTHTKRWPPPYISAYIGAVELRNRSPCKVCIFLNNAVHTIYPTTYQEGIYGNLDHENSCNNAPHHTFLYSVVYTNSMESVVPETIHQLITWWIQNQ